MQGLTGKSTACFCKEPGFRLCKARDSIPGAEKKEREKEVRGGRGKTEGERQRERENEREKTRERENQVLNPSELSSRKVSSGRRGWKVAITQTQKLATPLLCLKNSHTTLLQVENP